MNCIFCKIVNEEIPADIIGENDHAMAFNDLNPKAPVHFLIIPKVHIENVLGFTNDNIHILGKMTELANEIAEDNGISKTGFRWVINTGNDGGQTVFHLHLHLLGGRSLNWPPG